MKRDEVLEEDSESEKDSDVSLDEEEEAPGSSGALRSNPYFEGDSDSSSDLSCSEDSSMSEDEKEGEEEKIEVDDDDDEEDELIKALKKAREKQERKSPPDIRLSTEASDISFHPEINVIAVSSMDGGISLFEYDNEKNKLQKKLLLHKKNVRSIEFDEDGKYLYSASKDKSFRIINVETSQTEIYVPKAHDGSSLNKIKPINTFLCATGDEDGTVKLWDYRQKRAVMSEKRFDEFISDIYVDEEKKIMAVTSGEGTLQSFNIRGKRTDIQSEVYEGQLNCMGTVRSDSKLVVGCDNGKLYLFKWGLFGYHEDVFPGHPDAINALISVTDNVIITGCEDGALRAVHLYPHRFLGSVGHHEKSFPVEAIDVSSTGEFIASISHDQKVKFWSIKYLEECDYNKTKKPYKHKAHIKVKRKEHKMRAAQEIEHQLPSSHRCNRNDFFKDLC